MKKFLRKIISGLVLLIVIMVIGCGGKQITEIEASSEEPTLTQTKTETSEEEVIETPEEETIEEITEEITEATEETPEPEKYFTYKAKYVEKYPQALLITDESFPGDLRVSLSDDLPESFFEEIDCKTSEECFNQVIKGILDSLEGKEIILRDTQRGLPKFCYVDTTKPVELVFKYTQTKDQEIGPLYLPLWDEEQGIPFVSHAFVQRQDKGLRFIMYVSPKALEDMLNSPRERYRLSTGLYWMALILKFHPEILGWDQIDPGKIMAWGTPEEEENFCRKICQQDEPGLLFLGILTLKGQR